MSTRHSVSAFFARSAGSPAWQSRAACRACFEALEDRRLMSFSPAASYATDFNNNDGNLGLATANVDGTVQPAHALAGFQTVGDINGDGILDQATIEESVTGEIYPSELLYFSELITRLDNGDGTFAPAVRQMINFNGYPFHYYPGAVDSIIFSDLNGDRKLDAVAIVYQDNYG